jgi:hypothetical protein
VYETSNQPPNSFPSCLFEENCLQENRNGENSRQSARPFPYLPLKSTLAKVCENKGL